MLFHTKLLNAHRELDKAVMKLYGFSVGTSETECVAKLMERYQLLCMKMVKLPKEKQLGL